MKRKLAILIAVLSLGLGVALFAILGGPTGSTALASNDIAGSGCNELPSQADVLAAISATVHDADGNGFDLEAWATVVNRDGIVCAVAFTGGDRGSQWPGSRVISAQKANTANAFSLPGLALSTANLYSLAQPGGSLYGLQHSNPVDTDGAYGGSPKNYGAHNDPMMGG